MRDAGAEPASGAVPVVRVVRITRRVLTHLLAAADAGKYRSARIAWISNEKRDAFLAEDVPDFKSGRHELNMRPSGPKPDALPG